MHIAKEGKLHGARPELIRHADALPMRNRLRRLPAEIAHRGSGERDALENADAILRRALQRAGIGGDDIGRAGKRWDGYHKNTG
jgi:hypothetical protein